jgi:hypothetical protein
MKATGYSRTDITIKTVSITLDAGASIDSCDAVLRRIHYKGWRKKKEKRPSWGEPGEAPEPARAGWAVFKLVRSGHWQISWAGHGGLSRRAFWREPSLVSALHCSPARLHCAAYLTASVLLTFPWNIAFLCVLVA